MATIVVVFKILFLVLIAHSFVASAGSQQTASTRSSLERVDPPTTGWPQVQANSRGDEESAVLVSESGEVRAVSPRSRHERTSGSGGTSRPPPVPPSEPGDSSDEASGVVPSSGQTEETPTEGGRSSAAASSPRAAVNYAELCYLSDGGSSITLTVNEATQVGSIIGMVEVNGDPSLEGGNVDLFDALEAPKASGDSSPALSTGADSPPKPEVRQSRQMLTSGSGSSRLPPAGLMGLVSEHQVASNGGHAANFYSLVALGSQPPTQQPAVRLDPGTKRLILVRSLDKEGVEGEQSIVINVRCSPRLRADSRQLPAPGGSGKAAQQQPQDTTTIPIRILVTDANDHAPEFVGQQPYVVNISETTPIGTVVSRDILALDRDSAGPHSTVHYRVLEDGSAHSSLLQFANPLDPTLVVAGQLDYETLTSFTFTIVAQDQGEPEPMSSTAQVQVNVIDFDDQNPRFLDEKYNLIMDETQQSLVGQNLQVLPRNLYAEDGDRGINAPILYSFDQLGDFQATRSDEEGNLLSAAASQGAGSQTEDSNSSNREPNVERYLHLNPSTGEIRLIRQWPSSKMLASAPVTLVVRATQADNRDRYTLTTLTISRPAPGPSSQRALLSSVIGSSRTTASADSSSSSAADASDGQQMRAQLQQGIQFTPDRLTIDVPENVPINEKIAKVKAKYLPGGSPAEQQQQVATSAGASDASGDAAVDLVPEMSPPEQYSNKAAISVSNKTLQSHLLSRKTRLAAEHTLQLANKRPINYQILDDQTDQFGINGLGEIFVKRPLDYEQRQEYKFRVLATYTKYSDICQVLINVLNINDNKPKFTQPQYTFHLTESRLRSNILGAVQAHDADLNDTIRYNLLGEHAHLFEVSQSGQISLKTSIKQLNITSCQLIVQATDSLGPSPVHSQQARLNLHIAPQLVGRSLNLAEPVARQQQQAPEATKLFNSRSLTTDGQWNQRSPPAKEATSSQRSSVATVVASFQHMMRSVNLFDMPMSSTLLLTGLLAFLVCLLFIVIISMSVHFYRRRSKARHRHQLATATRFRHAHMAAAIHHAATGHANEPRARYLHGGTGSGPASSGSRGHGAGGSSTATTASPTGSQSTAPNHRSPNHLSPAAAKLRQISSPEPVSPRSVGHIGAAMAAANKAAVRRPLSVNSLGSGRRKSVRSPLEELSAQLEAVAAKGKQHQHHSLMASAANTTRAAGAESSLISSLSSQSKRSYRSNTTDDSSVMHCGHYNVTASQLSPPLKSSGLVTSRYSNGGDGLRSPIDGANSENFYHLSGGLENGGRDSATGGILATSATTSIKIQPNELTVLTNSNPGIKSYRKLPHLGSLVRPIRNNRVGAAELQQGARVTTMRQDREVASGRGQHQVEQQQQVKRDTHDSAIASDASSSNGSGIALKQHQFINDNHPSPGEHTYDATGNEDARGPEAGQQLESPRSLSPPPPPMNNIRWPQGAIPQRVKKLTWDDELSVANGGTDGDDDDCFVAPHLLQGSIGAYPMSPPLSHGTPSSRHHYPIEGTTNTEDQYAEQHFLFSNPCSPATLVSTDFTSASSALAPEAAALNPNRPPNGNGKQQQFLSEASSAMGQENCFDYTIVQSSQFRLDSIGSRERFESQQQQSLSAQHHSHLLQQLHQHSASPIKRTLSPEQQRTAISPLRQLKQKPPTTTTSYLYSCTSDNAGHPNMINGHSRLRSPHMAQNTNQDLNLMTTAVL